ncbi:MAG: hypothetical protein DRO88_04295 [Promethearchaeia archaeon]|nr:MAG: hypothetical protein DRO88_04295 [Candidatus Lokiarchaeia archaeon]
MDAIITDTSEQNSFLIRCKDLSVHYRQPNGHFTRVLSNLSLEIRQGENLVIIGPNGAGKTTLLKIIGLLISPTNGNIWFREKLLEKINARERLQIRRKIAFVHQKPVVLNTTVKKNLAYPLLIRRFPKKKIQQKVSQMLKLLELSKFINHPARKLSGGEMQRVAIGMSLIYEPELILFDESMANLDPSNQHLIEGLMQNLLNDQSKTLLITTHDPMEAIKFGDRIAVLNQGKIIQIDKPERIFLEPNDAFTAQFVGYENIFEGFGVIDSDTGINNIKINDITIAASKAREGKVKVCIRPESIVISHYRPKEISFRNILKGNIMKCNDLGIVFHVFVSVSTDVFLVSITRNAWNTLQLSLGEPVFISFKATDVQIL